MSPPPNADDAAAALIERGQALIDLERHAAAILELQRAVTLEPQNGTAHCLLAVALWHNGSQQRALEQLRQAAAVAPEDEMPHRLMSIYLLEKGRRTESLAAAREAVRLAPDGAHAHLALTQAALASGQVQEAGEVSRQLARLAPEAAWAHEMLGRVAMRSKDFEAAEQHYRRALRLDPRSYLALNNLGVVYQRQGQHQRAIEQFYEAVRVSPTEKLAQENLSGAVRGFLSGGRLPAVSLVFLLVLPPLRLLVFGWWLIDYFVLRPRRQRELPSGVITFYGHTQRLGLRRRRRTMAILGIALIIMLLLAFVASGDWSPFGEAQADQLLAIGLLLGLVAVGGCLAWYIRRRR